jgi:hypothetical protein
MKTLILFGGYEYCAPFHDECPKYHGHKGDPGVTPRTCKIVGEMGPSGPSVGEGPRRWKFLPLTKTMSHKSKTMSNA